MSEAIRDLERRLEAQAIEASKDYHRVVCAVYGGGQGYIVPEHQLWRWEAWKVIGKYKNGQKIG